ncbi:MAG: CYTH domain-containing protein [Solirubrobacteraceae bacterium]
MEIERKFLVASLPSDLTSHRSYAITQGYIAVGADGAEVRLRRAGERLLLSAKRGGGLVREEAEVALSDEQFETLWPATAGRRVQKTRYEIPVSDRLLIELDVYEGALTGLSVAEVEFPDVQAAARFGAPAWFGREVTDDDAYKNRRLALDGMPGDASSPVDPGS